MVLQPELLAGLANADDAFITPVLSWAWRSIFLVRTCRAGYGALLTDLQHHTQRERVFMRPGPKLSTPRSEDRRNPRLTFNSLQRQGRGRAIGKMFPVDFPEHSLHLGRLHHGNRARITNFEIYHEQQLRSSNGDLGWGSQSILFKHAPTSHPPPHNPVGIACLLRHSTPWHPLPPTSIAPLWSRSKRSKAKRTRDSWFCSNGYARKGGAGLSSKRENSRRHM